MSSKYVWSYINNVEEEKSFKKKEREREKGGVREIMNDRTDNLSYREDIKRSKKKKEI